MPALLIACGNPLRRDDAVAGEALNLLGPSLDRQLRTVHQLTPELAEDIAPFPVVVFLDADPASLRPAIEPIRASAQPSSLTHVAAPGEIVALARALFGFTGEAFRCRIPARDFSCAAGLSPDGLKWAQQAADELRKFL